MQAGDPRADPAVVDLVELAGLWLAAGDLQGLSRTLARLIDVLDQCYQAEAAYAARFRSLAERVSGLQQVAEVGVDEADELRRTYRRAIVG